jgi:hypothetical protein
MKQILGLVGILTLLLLPQIAGAYPGCYYRDIVIGGQQWASCNTSVR